MTAAESPLSRGFATLAADRRGGSFVQAIVLVSGLAIASLVAVKSMGGKLGDKFDCTGQSIQLLGPGGNPCSANGAGQPVALAAVPASFAQTPVPQPTPTGTPQPSVTAVPQPTPDPSASTPAPSALPTPSPSPGVSPTPPPPEENKFTPEDEEKVKQLIADAIARHNGDIALAFVDLRDQRQRPENFFDTNLAIAADYLRARLEVRRNGPFVARDEVEAYLLLKRTVGVPKEGPGPVSPFSELQAKYMRLGVQDEMAEMSPAEIAFFLTPVGDAFGRARFLFDSVRGDE
jgi:hypothetical protein